MVAEQGSTPSDTSIVDTHTHATNTASDTHADDSSASTSSTSATETEAHNAAGAIALRQLATQLIAGDAALRSVVESAATPASTSASASTSAPIPASAPASMLTVGAVLGVRPPLAAAVAHERMTVVVVPSSRDAEEFVQAARAWYQGNPQDIAQLEAWETLPHERLSPRADTVASRMAVFRRLVHPQAESALFAPIRMLVMPVRSLIQPIVAGLGDVEPLIFALHEHISLTHAVQMLVRNAYTRVDLVMDRGEFAVRGGILDVFIPTSPHPVRIEFFGDDIDDMKYFHASDQRTFGEAISEQWATPCRELQLTDAVRERAGELQGVIAGADDMLASIAQGMPVEGMESLMPALVERMQPVSSLIDKQAVYMLCDPEKLRRSAEDLRKTADEFLAASWHVAASGTAAPAPLSLEQASFEDYEDCVNRLRMAGSTVWQCSSFTVDEQLAQHVQIPAEAAQEYRGDEAHARQGIERLLAEGYQVVITAPAQGTLARLKRMINLSGITTFTSVQAQIADGFIDTAARIAVLTERDITGRATAAQQRKTPKRRRQAVDLMELKPGDYVVHEQHGVGKFVGIRHRQVLTTVHRHGAPAANEREYLVIEYASSKRGAPHDMLYVPADQLDVLSKYVGAEEPKLNKLGGSDWAETKARARKHVREVAQHLVQLYSARQRMQGHAFSKDTPWQKELEDAFPYQETSDQLTTIDDVKADMERATPMDRLICGDVGFGKTEIAVRAAFKAIQDGKQVAVLVPTTLLVQQHFETFSERFEGFPVHIAALSRFQSAKEIAATLEGLASGSVDLVIGTHKLLSSKVKFKDLGLLIIDEEQRFGVEHKEAIKALQKNVDVLSLSATPIPRTLEMAVTGIREMSMLATPPEDRLPVLTYVGAYDDAQVTAAIRRELLRGGQVFYVHNRVADIDAVATHIHDLVPEARVGVAHGKMNEKQLDTIIREFWHRDIDVLICTTIIETGLDIANANTLLVDQADRFGLSQLHQLRGRVGRGRERAYAYFLYDPTRTMTQQSHDRLATIAQHSALGSGYDVAMKDLELRGTGNLLGDEQSGHIEGVGFDLYVRMVSEAVQAYKEPKAQEPVSVSIDLPLNALIPVSYMNAEQLRLEAYKKLAQAHTDEQLRDLREEFVDRYGALPPELETLFAVAKLRNRARAMGIEQIAAQGRMVRFTPCTPPESAQLRLARVYKGLQYRPATHTLLIPSPVASGMSASLNASANTHMNAQVHAHVKHVGEAAKAQEEAAQSERLIAWVNQVLDDIAWQPGRQADR